MYGEAGINIYTGLFTILPPQQLPHLFSLLASGKTVCRVKVTCEHCASNRDSQAAAFNCKDMSCVLSNVNRRLSGTASSKPSGWSCDFPCDSLQREPESFKQLRHKKHTMMVSFLPEPCALHLRPYSAASRCTAAPSVLPIFVGSPCSRDQLNIVSIVRGATLCVGRT